MKEVAEHREISAEETAEIEDSHSVIITPGRGMAGAQAQYPVAQITETARAWRRCALVFTRLPGVCGPHERAAGGKRSALRYRA
ncbi:NAD(P)(+) transhydrogenase (Re/Si-specific) subunit beta [Shigella flexneri]